MTGVASYDPFGKLLQREGASDPFGFTGERSGATGLQYLRARWYDPSSGRFTQVDPFAGVLELPGTQHPYAYGLNNPLRYADPSGRVAGIDDATFVTAFWGVVAVSAISGLVAGVTEAVMEYIACLQRGASFQEAFGCLNLGKIAGAAISAATSTFFMGTALLLLFPPLRGAVVAYGALKMLGVVVICIVVGIDSNVIGDILGRFSEYLLNGTIEPERDLMNPASYKDDIKYGILFGGVCGLFTVGANLFKAAIAIHSSAAATSLKNLPPYHGEQLTYESHFDLPLRRWTPEDIILLNIIDPVMLAYEKIMSRVAGLSTWESIIEFISNYLLNSTAYSSLVAPRQEDFNGQ